MSYQDWQSNVSQDNQQKLTPEEETYIKGCVQSSIWTRSIPAAIGGSYLWWFVQVKYRGQPQSRFGPVLAGTLAAVAARFVSLYDCVNKALDKFPDGTLAQVNRDLVEEKMKFATQRRPFTMPQNEVDSSSRGYLPEQQGPSFLDIDTSVPEQKGLTESVLHEDLPVSKAPLLNQTYEEMRRRNREDTKFSTNQRRAMGVQGSYSENTSVTSTAPGLEGTYSSTTGVPPATAYFGPVTPGSTYVESTMTGSVFMDSPSSPSFDNVPITPTDEPKSRKFKKVNKYGDEWEE